MDAKKITEQELIEVLNTGSVDFGVSKREGADKIYILEKDDQYFAFTLPKESFVSEVFIGVKNSKKVKPSASGTGKIIHFPKDDDLVYPDSNSVLSCQQDQLKLVNPRDILRLLKKNGRLDFEKSKLDQKPKPEHYLVFEQKKRKIGARAIWYKNKINITLFEAENLKECN